MSNSLYNPFLFSAFLDRRTFKNDGPSGNGGDDNNGAPPATVYENDYSDPNNPKLDTDPNTPGTQVSTVGHSTDNDSSSQTIQSGDTVSQIALDNNTTIEQIKADNPGIDINNIKAGETINITSDTRGPGESIYTGATQAELDAGNAQAEAEAAAQAQAAAAAQAAADEAAAIQAQVAAQAAADEAAAIQAQAAAAAQAAAEAEAAAAAQAEADLFEIDDGDGTDFSLVPGDARDDVYFDLSDPAERLVTENGVGFTGTYGGVTYTDGYEVKEPLQVEITPGGDIGASIDDALGADITTSAGGANTATEALLDLTADMASGDVDVDTATATLNLITGKDLTADDVAALMPPGTSTGTTGTTEVDASITPERLEDLQGYVDSLTSMQGGYTAEDLDAAGFTASEILAFEQGLSTPGLTQAEIDAMEAQYGTLQEAPNTFESAANAIRGGSDLTLGEIAAGLGYDTVGGFLEELALRVQGTGTMADDALSILSSYNIDQYEFTDPNTGEKVIADLDGVDRTGTTSGVSAALAPAVEYLSDQSKKVLANQSDEYKKLIADGMPDPNNEGYNMAGEKITPGAWMASVAAQELIGLGLDVGTVMLLGPVAGGAVAFQQGTAEAGAAAANETKAELESLRASGALDHLSEEEFNTVVDTAETQAFYTSGVAGGAVDTLVALTAGGFAPLAKALPTAINSAITGLGVLGAEGVSGGLEQVGVNAAVIKALEDQGIDPADYDKGYLDQVITAAIYETVGGTGASAASTVGSAVQNLSAKSGGEAQSGYDDLGGALTTVGGDTQTGTGSTYDDLGGALLTQTNKQGVNTINTQTVTDAEGQTHTVDTAVDANGNTSVTVTNDATGSSTTTDVGTGTLNSVNVGAGTSIIVDTSNTSNTNEVETIVLESGSSLTQTGETITGSETILGGAAGDASAGSTASEDLLGGGVDDDDTNVVDLYDSGKVYRRDGIMYLGNPANNVKAEGNIDGTLYADGQVIIGMGPAETGTGGIGTIFTGVTGTGDATTGVTGTGDANTTITATNDATVTTTSDGVVTVTTVTDANGNATVTTKNSVTGETTTDNVAVNDTATVTNGGVTVDVNAATDGTTTTTTETTQTGVSSEVDGVVDVGTTADAVVQAATTTTVEQPVVEQPVAVTDVPVVDPTSFTPTDTDGDPDTLPVGETEPGYTSGIAGLGGGARPVVSPYYQPQQTGEYNFYVPQPGVDQTVPAGPVFSQPASYLAPTAQPQYGYGYIAPNAELEYLRRLAQIQGTGDELLPSEDLMSGT